MKVTSAIAAHTDGGEAVHLFRVETTAGAFIELLDWGARWVRAVMPDACNKLSDVLMGYDHLEDYLTDNYYMGATIGRFANRIADATFVIDGNTYLLEANDGRNTNHGGQSGFHHKRWNSEVIADGVRFSLISPHGEGGYPGNVPISVTYQLSEENEVTVTYHGATDCSTYLNLTNHAYFNLSGTGQEIADHQLMIPATYMLETTPAFIPTGKKVSVINTPFDFTHPKQIGEQLHADNEQLRQNRGYNHCYVLKEQASGESVLAASLLHAATGRQLIVETDLPGVLLYTAGYYEHPNTAVCLETQFFPDTPHHPHFPSCLLHPGEVYEQQTCYKFNRYTHE